MRLNDKLLSAFILIFILLSIGTLIYNVIEGWSYVDAFYFTAMTLTTVGYGDLVPTTNASKLFTVFFSLAGIAIVLVILATIGRDYYRKERIALGRRIERYLEARKVRAAVKKRRHTLKAKKSGAAKRRRLFGWSK